jgi:cytochrome c2
MRTLLARAAVLAVLWSLVASALAEGESKAIREYRPAPGKSVASPSPGALWLRGRVPFSLSAGPTPPDLPTECFETSDTQSWKQWRDRAIAGLLAPHVPNDEERRVVKQDVPFLVRLEVADRASALVATLDRCIAEGKAPPEGALGNLVRFVRTQHNATLDDHQFGHGPVVTDNEYLSKTYALPALELPCLFRSQEFLGAMSSPKTYWKADELIRKRNEGKFIASCPEPTPPTRLWDVLIFRSRFLTTPDGDTLGRFLVVVPGENEQPDRWIQFGIWTPQDPCYKQTKDCKPIQNVSVIAVAKVGGTIPPQVPPLRSYDATVDWYRCAATSPPGGCDMPAEGVPLTLRPRYESKKETDDCQRCHKMNPLSIHPEFAYRVDRRTGLLKKLRDAEQAAAKVNRYIGQRKTHYSRAPIFSTDPAKDGFAHWQNYGEKGFGAEPDHPRSDEWLKACSAPYRLNAAARKRVLDSMTCHDCHSGRLAPPGRLGVLNYPQGTDRRRLIQFEPKLDRFAPNIIRSHILKGVMPVEWVDGKFGKPGYYTRVNGLKSPREREALFECLSLEYFNPEGPSGLFVDWLKGEKDPSTFAAITGRPPQEATPEQHAFWSGRAQLAPAPLKTPTPAADFASYCARCHRADGTATAKGPALRGVVGRAIASAGYADYSDALRELGRKYPTWDEARLLEFLKDPDAYLSAELGGTQESAMNRRVVDVDVRQRIFNFLSTLK